MKKTYRIQSIGELNCEDKFYYLDRAPTLDIHPKSGVWEQIDENNFDFIWSEYARNLHSKRK